ncbi:MAG: metallophosphoesterase family protein [Vicinamibacteraceae bacterium]
MIRVGLISDTHGLLRPEALAFLAGSDHIVHAGDVGDPTILEALAAIAPLTAIRGNVDTDAWARRLPETTRVTIDGVTIHVLHDVAALRIEPHAHGIRVVVFGHSHKPSVTERDGVLYVNPGSAGPRRFRLPIAVAELRIDSGSVSAHIHELAPG